MKKLILALFLFGSVSANAASIIVFGFKEQRMAYGSLFSSALAQANSFEEAETILINQLGVTVQIGARGNCVAAVQGHIEGEVKTYSTADSTEEEARTRILEYCGEKLGRYGSSCEIINSGCVQ